MPAIVATIRKATSRVDVDTVRTLFEEYQVVIAKEGGKPAENHVCFQEFGAELAGLSEMYGPPAGALWLAEDDEGPLACVGLRPGPQARQAEMKRLYVRDRGRGQGLGRQLANALIDEAHKLGYRRLVLDTLPSMKAAIGLYASLGFQPQAARNDTMQAESLFFEKILA